MELLNRNGLNYFSKGEGKYLYLIQFGFPDCAHNFEDQIEFFSQRGFKVVAPYLPGYHENDKDLDSYQSLRVAEVLTDFIESISGNEKVYLFGHDWGAPIVYAIAQTRPDLLKKIFSSICTSWSFGTNCFFNRRCAAKSLGICFLSVTPCRFISTYK